MSFSPQGCKELHTAESDHVCVHRPTFLPEIQYSLGIMKQDSCFCKQQSFDWGDDSYAFKTFSSRL